jgi:hypothetical protein
LIENELNSIASKLLEWMFASSNRPLAQKGAPEGTEKLRLRRYKTHIQREREREGEREQRLNNKGTKKSVVDLI